MKRITLTAAVLILMSGFAKANEYRSSRDNESTLISQKDAVISVSYKNEKTISLLIEIVNEYDVTLHKEEVKTKKGFSKSFNLNDYGSGKYTFRINDGNGNIERVVRIANEAKVALYRLSGSKRVKFITADPNKKVIIEMYDMDDQLIQRDYINSGETGVSRIYDLSKRRKGDTKFQVRYGSKIVKSSEF